MHIHIKGFKFIDPDSFGKLTKRGWQYSAQNKVDALAEVTNDMVNVTARNDKRDKLVELEDVIRQRAELEAKYDKLLDECADIIMETGETIDEKGNKWVTFIQEKGKAIPLALSFTRAYVRADYSRWCEDNNITAEWLIEQGYAVDVKESKKISRAGKTHLDDLVKKFCKAVTEALTAE